MEMVEERLREEGKRKRERAIIVSFAVDDPQPLHSSLSTPTVEVEIRVNILYTRRAV